MLIADMDLLGVKSLEQGSRVPRLDLVQESRSRANKIFLDRVLYPLGRILNPRFKTIVGLVEEGKCENEQEACDEVTIRVRSFGRRPMSRATRVHGAHMSRG